jgi:ABC-type transporter MlaC component
MTRKALLLSLMSITVAFAAPKKPAIDPLTTFKTNDKILQDMLRRFPKETLSSNDSLRKHLGVMFGFGELGKRALGKSWAGKPKADQDSFRVNFTKMVEKTALQNPQDYLSDSAVSVLVGKVSDTATIRSTVYRGSSQVLVTYKLYTDGPIWRIYDLKVGDKPSQVEKYRNQFTQYFKKKTFSDLVVSIKKNAAN